MQSQALPVVQKEQGSAWLYALERARGVPVMDGADAELVADAVFCAHELRLRGVREFVGFVHRNGSGSMIDGLRKGVGDILSVSHLFGNELQLRLQRQGAQQKRIGLTW